MIEQITEYYDKCAIIIRNLLYTEQGKETKTRELWNTQTQTLQQKKR